MFKEILIILIVLMLVFGLNGLSFAMMCGGHSQHQGSAQTESSEHKHLEEEVSVEAEEEVINVGNEICPVSGEKIGEKTKATYEYEGKVYNFCCEMCIDEFKKDPQKYIKKVEEELQSESKEESKHEEHEMQMMQEPETLHEGMHQGHHHSH